MSRTSAGNTPWLGGSTAALGSPRDTFLMGLAAHGPLLGLSAETAVCDPSSRLDFLRVWWPGGWLSYLEGQGWGNRGASL